MRYTAIVAIDMSMACVECGTRGSCGNGLCLRCTGAALDPASTMTTPEGRAVQQAFDRDRDRLAHVPAKWVRFADKGHAPTWDSTARPASDGTRSDPS